MAQPNLSKKGVQRAAMTTDPQITSGNAKFAGVCVGVKCYKNTGQANDVTMLQSARIGSAAEQEMGDNGAICKSLSILSSIFVLHAI